MTREVGMVVQEQGAHEKRYTGRLARYIRPFFSFIKLRKLNIDFVYEKIVKGLKLDNTSQLPR